MALKPQIVADGGLRLWRGQKAIASESIEKKYALELAKAGPDEKKEIHRRMLAEIEQRRKIAEHKPSSAALW